MIARTIFVNRFRLRDATAAAAGRSKIREVYSSHVAISANGWVPFIPRSSLVLRFILDV
jgi:hypothetical protein